MIILIIKSIITIIKDLFRLQLLIAKILDFRSIVKVFVNHYFITINFLIILLTNFLVALRHHHIFNHQVLYLNFLTIDLKVLHLSLRLSHRLSLNHHLDHRLDLQVPLSLQGHHLIIVEALVFHQISIIKLGHDYWKQLLELFHILLLVSLKFPSIILLLH